MPVRHRESVDDDERYFNCRMSGEPVLGLVKLMPRLEVLYLFTQELDTTQLFGLRTLTHLRELLVYHMDRYPLHLLAKKKENRPRDFQEILPVLRDLRVFSSTR